MTVFALSCQALQMVSCQSALRISVLQKKYFCMLAFCELISALYFLDFGFFFFSCAVELLVKVGEVVDKLFDLDEELMLNWIKSGTCQSVGPSTDDSPEELPDFKIVPCILEAAKQVRCVGVLFGFVAGGTLCNLVC